MQRFYPSKSILAALFTALSAITLHATTIVLPTDEQLVDKTPLIVVATVESSRVVESNGALRTETSLRVEEILKGSSPVEVTVSELGGVVGEKMNVIFGAPQYREGERVLAFLAPYRDGSYRTRDLFVGKFTEKRAADGTRLWFRPANPDAVLLDHDFQPLTLGTTQRDADGFERFINDRVAGKPAGVKYQIENPLLDESSSTRSGRIESNFTLISEPTVYRWASFDRGSSANWYSAGTQTGYSGGGVNEIQSAIRAWTGFSSAKILYNYSGQRSGAPVGLRSPDGVNEIIFNDITNEIDGTFNRSTGGVVGLGGFNNTAPGGVWNGPFAADSTHAARSYSTYAITEANLVIQDGVTPANGISSAILAEIVAHELGHTLGFGHSSDGSALMYYSVTGGGAVLRADDQLAARWLYPNGGSTPPPPPPPPPSAPAAPSGLTAVLSGASTAQLRWNDNASNETTQTVYSSMNGGAFSRVGDVAANATSVSLSSLAAGTTYRFYVTAKNSAGESSPSNTAQVVTSPPVTPTVAADFDASTYNARVGESITFTDRSTNATTWSWNFGDGSTSTQRNPTHAFAGSGSFNVTLTASNGSSSNARAKAIAVATTPSGGSAFESVIAVTAQTAGTGATYWRTEVSIFNASSFGVSVELTYIPGAGASVQRRSTTVAPHAVLSYGNVLRDLYGLASGAGALVIRGTSPSGAPELKVTSRTFTNSPAGTYGQGVPDVRSDASPTRLYLTGLESDGSYRTNIGLVNRTAANVGATLTLVDANGSSIGQTSITVPANNFQQSGITSLFPQLGASARQAMSIRVDASSANALFAYASIIDNRSQDPVYVGAAAPLNDVGVIPVVGRAAGANNTYWRSDVTLFNPASSTMTVAMKFWSSGVDNRNAATRSVNIAAGRSVVVADVLTSFGVGSGSGALEISWSGSASGPVVTSRTYTARSDGATYGQSIDVAPVSGFGGRSVVTGLRNDGGYRTNVGMVNRGVQTSGITLTLYSSFGNVVASKVITLAPKSQTQMSLSSLAPNVDLGALGTLTLMAESSSGTILAYGSVVDNLSGDPVYVGGE